MSRSFRKTPIFGITTATSEKQDKRRWNKAFRRIAGRHIARDQEPPRHLNAVSNVWTGQKDGKRYWAKSALPAKHMRK